MTFFLGIWNSILEFKEHDWAQNVIVLSLFSAFLWLSWRLIVTRLHRIAAKTKLPWDDAVISAISSPITLVIWLWPASTSLKIILSNHTQQLNKSIISKVLSDIMLMTPKKQKETTLTGSLSSQIEQFEKTVLTTYLEKHQGHLQTIANRLELSKGSLDYRLRKFNLSAKEWRY